MCFLPRHQNIPIFLPRKSLTCTPVRAACPAQISAILYRVSLVSFVCFLSVVLCHILLIPIRFFENHRHSLSTYIFRSLPIRLAFYCSTGCSLDCCTVLFSCKILLRGATYCGKERRGSCKSIKIQKKASKVRVYKKKRREREKY